MGFMDGCQAVLGFGYPRKHAEAGSYFRSDISFRFVPIKRKYAALVEMKFTNVRIKMANTLHGVRREKIKSG